jgi:hypothetical protein
MNRLKIAYILYYDTGSALRKLVIALVIPASFVTCNCPEWCCYPKAPRLKGGVQLCVLQNCCLTIFLKLNYLLYYGVVRLVEALRYKPGGSGFDSRWCHLKFFIDKSFQPHYGPGVESASNRNECQEYFFWSKDGQCYGGQSCHLEIWEPQSPGTLGTCLGL